MVIATEGGLVLQRANKRADALWSTSPPSSLIYKKEGDISLLDFLVTSFLRSFNKSQCISDWLYLGQRPPPFISRASDWTTIFSVSFPMVIVIMSPSFS